MIGMDIEKYLRKILVKFLSISFLVIFSGNVSSQSVESVIDSYGACSWRDNGNGTSTVDLIINFKSISRTFLSRAILVYSYDRNGVMRPGRDVVRTMMMDGVHFNVFSIWVGDYAIYANHWDMPWINGRAFSANVNIVINNSAVADWPALSIRAANKYGGLSFVAEVNGGAYISSDSSTSSCKVIDPPKPPPPDIRIDVTAPDWNLGELPAGSGEKMFSNSTDQLCFSYSGAAVSGKSFIINASNVNGVVNGRYRLRNVNDATQEVPYDIKLDRGSSIQHLPNVGNVALPLDGSGKTCFVPTFRTTVDKTLKEGAYSDVLTFTVVTKS
jgi:hypothetical protein